MSNKMLLEFPVKPESRDEFLAAMLPALPDTVKFEGCLGVKVWTPEDEPARVIVFEEWESKDNQAKYFAWRMESGMMDSIGPMLAGQPKVIWLDEHPF